MAEKVVVIFIEGDTDVIDELKSKGACQVSQVLARKSIEDWFLYDWKGSVHI